MMELISAHNERHIGEMITDLESDEPTGRERSITESVSESTYETLYCGICGSSCEYGDENWDYISMYGMCRSCYTFQSEAQEEMYDSEERWAEENGYIEADYNPADYNVFRRYGGGQPSTVMVAPQIISVAGKVYTILYTFSLSTFS